MTGVDHQPLKVGVIHQRFQNLFPDSLAAPPAEPAVYILPISIRFWKIPPGPPVRKVQNTPLINCRVSRALPPRVPFSPIVYGLIFSHALSPISCRCCSPAIFLPSRYFGDYYTSFLLTTLSSRYRAENTSANAESLPHLPRSFYRGCQSAAKMLLASLRIVPVYKREDFLGLGNYKL